MKKLLAMSIVCMMLVTFFAPSSFALNAQEAEEYAKAAVGDELSSLNRDAKDGVSLRPEQLKIVEDAKNSFNEKFDDDGNIIDPEFGNLLNTIADEIDTSVSKSTRSVDVERFMTLRYFETQDQATLTPLLQSVIGEFKSIDTNPMYSLAGIAVGEVKDTLNEYTNKVSELYENALGSADQPTKELIDSKKDDINAFRKEEIMLSIKALLSVIFVSTEEEFLDVYNAFRGVGLTDVKTKAADLRLKHIALYLKPFADANISLSTIKTSAEKYAEANKSTLKEKAKTTYTKDRSIKEAIEMSHDLLKEVVYGAYEKYTADKSEDPDVSAWLEIFFGKKDESNPGVIERIMLALDENGEYQNILANIAIRKALQMSLPSGKTFITESATKKERITISDGDFASFIIDKPEGIDIDKIGINTDTISIPLSLFNVVIECEETDYNDDVKYENGKFTITRNSKLPSTYDATITVYRSKVVGKAPVDSYIESYLVTIKNPEKTPTYRPSSSSGKSFITIRLPENGSVVGPSVVKKGENAEFEAIADSGYAVGKIFVNGKEITDYTRDGVNAKFTVENITANATIDVKFIKLLNDKISYAYIKGYPEGDVRPNNNLTREEAAQIFYRILTKEAKDEFSTEENNYTDVVKTRWSNKAISTLSNIGILTGFPDGSFGPAQTITRAQFATIVYRFYNVKYSGPDKFTDIAGHWAQSSINAIAVNDWIKGYEDSTFGPNRNITRAEAVTIINRILEREFSAEKFNNKETFFDCSVNNWFYADIMEASTGEIIE